MGLDAGFEAAFDVGLVAGFDVGLVAVLDLGFVVLADLGFDAAALTAACERSWLNASNVVFIILHEPSLHQSFCSKPSWWWPCQ